MEELLITIYCKATGKTTIPKALYLISETEEIILCVEITLNISSDVAYSSLPYYVKRRL